MNWKECKTPEQAFGKRDQPRNYLGELVYDYVETLLTSSEVKDLHFILQLLFSAANKRDSQINILLMGSVLNGENKNSDLDLICCTEPITKRIHVVDEFAKSCEPYHYFELRETTNNLLVPTKIFVAPHKPINIFDISFVGESAGSWVDLISFYQYTKLTYCVLT